MKYTEIVKQVEQLVAECELYSKQYGDKALELVADYPLYASSSNISFGEAILIASVFGDIDRQKDGANWWRSILIHYQKARLVVGRTMKSGWQKEGEKGKRNEILYS